MNKYQINPLWKNEKYIDVALIGAGGTGSSMLKQMFQMDNLFKRLQMPRLNITVYDPDTVSSSNIGRQSFWHGDVGLNKCEVLASRYNNYGGVYIHAVPHKFDVEDISQQNIDLLVTCSDSVTLRKDLGEYCDQNYLEQHSGNMLWADLGNGSHTAQVCLGTMIQGTDEIILPCVHELYPDLKNLLESNEPSCSTFEALLAQDYGINEKVAIEGATLIWQLLRHHEITRHGSMIDIKNGYTTPIQINNTAWQMMGMRSSRPILPT